MKYQDSVGNMVLPVNLLKDTQDQMLRKSMVINITHDMVPDQYRQHKDVRVTTDQRPLPETFY